MKYVSGLWEEAWVPGEKPAYAQEEHANKHIKVPAGIWTMLFAESTQCAESTVCAERANHCATQPMRKTSVF